VQHSQHTVLWSMKTFTENWFLSHSRWKNSSYDTGWTEHSFMIQTFPALPLYSQLCYADNQWYAKYSAAL